MAVHAWRQERAHELVAAWARATRVTPRGRAGIRAREHAGGRARTIWWMVRKSVYPTPRRTAVHSSICLAACPSPHRCGSLTVMMSRDPSAHRPPCATWGLPMTHHAPHLCWRPLSTFLSRRVHPLFTQDMG